MWMQTIAVGYLQYVRIVYVFLTHIFSIYFFFGKKINQNFI
jgi:hypothetical protein